MATKEGYLPIDRSMSLETALSVLGLFDSKQGLFVVDATMEALIEQTSRFLRARTTDLARLHIDDLYVLRDILSRTKGEEKRSAPELAHIRDAYITVNTYLRGLVDGRLFQSKEMVR